MSTSREDLKNLIDRLGERQVLMLWRVAAAMRPSEELTSEEAARVDQALKEIEAGEFSDWQDLKRAL